MGSRKGPLRKYIFDELHFVKGLLEPELGKKKKKTTEEADRSLSETVAVFEDDWKSELSARHESSNLVFLQKSQISNAATLL